MVQEREQDLRAGDDALSLELRRAGESGFREAMRGCIPCDAGSCFFVGIGLGVCDTQLGFSLVACALLQEFYRRVV